jgi:molybdopterin-containing oxidoreductase family iron-sulfur binding subunit
MTGKRFAMVINTKRCIGCHTCAMACKLENNEPDRIWWNRVLTMGGNNMDTPAGEFPNLQIGFITLACQHCKNPACVKVCPVGATYQDETTGMVVQDNNKCIGCRSCMVACPYNGVRQFNWMKPQFSTGFTVGAEGVATHQTGVVEKCTFCQHRLPMGLEPACIEVCPGRARFFGDINDPVSQISQLLLKRPYFKLLVEMGTDPSVYFLI